MWGNERFGVPTRSKNVSLSVYRGWGSRLEEAEVWVCIATGRANDPGRDIEIGRRAGAIGLAAAENGIDDMGRDGGGIAI